MKTTRESTPSSSARWTTHICRVLHGNKILPAIALTAFICTAGVVVCAEETPAAAKPAESSKPAESVKPAESGKTRNSELSKREEAVRKEEERLNALKAEVDNKIAEYEKLLKQLEAVMAKLKETNSERMNNLVKTYEMMPAEIAAKDLEIQDEELAVTILVKMKSRKSAAILASMGQRKAAVLTEQMSRVTKKIPVK